MCVICIWCLYMCEMKHSPILMYVELSNNLECWSFPSPSLVTRAPCLPLHCFHQASQPGHFQGFFCFHSPSCSKDNGITDVSYYACFYMHSGNLNSGPYTYMARSLPPESSPQPYPPFNYVTKRSAEQLEVTQACGYRRVMLHRENRSRVRLRENEYWIHYPTRC